MPNPPTVPTDEDLHKIAEQMAYNIDGAYGGECMFPPLVKSACFEYLREVRDRTWEATLEEIANVVKSSPLQVQNGMLVGWIRGLIKDSHDKQF